jgi:hypothetical protein
VNKSHCWYILDVVPKVPLNLVLLGYDGSSRSTNRASLEELMALTPAGEWRVDSVEYAVLCFLA